MFEEVYSKIEDYCNYRIGTGYSGFSAKKGIKKFLDYCLVNFPDETTITKNMVDSWLNHRAHMSSNTQAKSVTHIRAMHLYIAGVPLPLVSEWLGHSNEETTRIYAKVTDEMKRKAQQKVNEALKEIMEEDPVFKYANDEDVLKKLSGLK